jgi:hypothetical protein
VRKKSWRPWAALVLISVGFAIGTPACGSVEPNLFAPSEAGASGVDSAHVAGSPGAAGVGTTALSDAGAQQLETGVGGANQAGAPGGAAPVSHGGTAPIAGGTSSAGAGGSVATMGGTTAAGSGPLAGGNGTGGRMSGAGTSGGMTGGGASNNAGAGGLGGPSAGSTGLCEMCDTAHSLFASCTIDGGCLYSGCVAGFVDCTTTAPNLNGCACRGNACCGNRCQTAHDDGVGDKFYDCEALRTYTVEQALSAADADTAQLGIASDHWSCGNDQNGATTGVCKTTDGQMGSCTCWVYAATGADINRVGRVQVSTTGGCVCPTSTSPTWN